MDRYIALIAFLILLLLAVIAGRNKPMEAETGECEDCKYCDLDYPFEYARCEIDGNSCALKNVNCRCREYERY